MCSCVCNNNVTFNFSDNELGKNYHFIHYSKCEMYKWTQKYQKKYFKLNATPHYMHISYVCRQ